MAMESNNLEEILRPFTKELLKQRFSLLQRKIIYKKHSFSSFVLHLGFGDRLARLEACLAKKNESGNYEQPKLVGELQLLLESTKNEQLAEREKAMKEVQQLTTENSKLQYQIIHLVRAVKEVDSKLAAK